MTTKRCSKCQLVKSTSQFNKHKNCRGGFNTACKSCCSIREAQRSERGLNILQNLAIHRGCCNHCQRPYTNKDWHFFEFDHIDPSLKKARRETETRWVSGHQVEFFERVAPNLQLLCVKCHKIKSIEEQKLNGVVYQKMFGESKPPEIIELGWNLFSQAPTLEDRETFSYHSREGDWITVRDINGKLISYEPYQNFIKTE